MTMRIRLRQWSAFAGTFSLAVGSHGCSENAAPTEIALPAVVVREVEVRDVDVEIQSPIEPKPIAEVEVGSKVVGYLESVLVDRGDRVMRGQMLAVVRPSDQAAQLLSARGSLAEAHA